MRALTPLESVASVSIFGSLAAVFIPAFVGNLRASRLSEPLEGLQQIGVRATMLAESRELPEAYPTSVGLTPAQVPQGKSVEDPLGTWQQPTWEELGFGFSEAHHYSFSFESTNKASGSRFKASARGDLDGDGLFSTFELSGEMMPGKSPVVYHIEMEREVE